MLKYFNIKISSEFKSEVEKFNIILIILNEYEIEQLKKDSIWHNDRAGYEVLENNEIGTNQIPLVVILDHSFTIRNISLDREFFGFKTNSINRSRYLADRVPLLIKQCLVEVIKLMQKTMKTNEVNMNDFIAQIAKNTKEKETSMQWEVSSSKVEKISFYLVVESDRKQLK
jgi:hypothetical protein